MSAADDAAAALAGFVPLGEETPQAQALGAAVAAEVAARPGPAGQVDPAVLAELRARAADPLPEFLDSGCVTADATGVARPGDVLIVGGPAQLTPEQAHQLREQLMRKLPGIANVLVLPGLTVEGIYRGGSPP